MSFNLLFHIYKSLFKKSWFLLFLMIAAVMSLVLSLHQNGGDIFMNTDIYVVRSMGVLALSLFVASLFQRGKDAVFWLSRPVSRTAYITTHFMAALVFAEVLLFLYAVMAFAVTNTIDWVELLVLWAHFAVIASFCMRINTYKDDIGLNIILAIILYGFILYKDALINFMFSSDISGMEIVGYVTIGVSFVIPNFSGDLLSFLAHSIAFIAFMYVSTMHDFLKRQF